jgi:m7GpppX diphosphatase
MASGSEPPSKRAKETETEAAVTMMDTDEQTKESDSSTRVSPTSILSQECKVQTLTVSDQHATLLLTQDSTAADENGDATPSSVQSLLKLTLIPFHKVLLGSNPVLSPDDAQKPDLKLLEHDPVASEQIRAFLKDYEFKLKSESGAEYSYYSAKPSSGLCSITVAPESLEKEAATAGACNAFGSFDVELISPCNDRQISRAMPSLGSTLINETPELYQNAVQPYIQSIVDSNSLGWINNIIEVKKEEERLLVNSPLFIINIDTKWRSHPPPLTTPREEWYGHKSLSDLYCLGIVKQKGLATLRDLTGEHILLLESMEKEGYEAIEKIYGVKADQIRCFVHYQPQFYHFHVHFTRLENEIGSTVEKGHLVSDIIQNLEMDSLYYSKRTITYKLKKLTPLHNLIETYLASVEK